MATGPPSCVVCAAPAASEARLKSTFHGASDVVLAVCGEVCLMKHIEAKRRNKDGQLRDDIDSEDRENEIADANGVYTEPGRTVRLGYPDPSVAPAPGVSTVLRAYKDPRPRTEEPPPSPSAADAASPPLMAYIDLTDEDDDEPSLEGPVDGGTIAPANPEDMIPKTRLEPQLAYIDLTGDDAEPLPADEVAPYMVQDPISGEYQMDGPLAVAQEPDNNDEDRDIMGPLLTPTPAPEPLERTDYDFRSFSGTLENRNVLGHRFDVNSIVDEEALLASSTNVALMKSINRWLGGELKDNPGILSQIAPIGLWVIDTLSRGDPILGTEGTTAETLVVYVTRGPSSFMPPNMFAKPESGPFVGLYDAVKEQEMAPMKRLPPHPAYEGGPMRPAQYRLIMLNAQDYETLNAVSMFGTVSSPLFSRHPSRMNPVTLLDVRRFIETHALNDTFELLPGPLPRRANAEGAYDAGIPTELRSQSAPTWGVWSAYQFQYYTGNDLFHWTADGTGDDQLRLVSIGSTAQSIFKRRATDLSPIGFHTFLLAAAAIRGSRLDYDAIEQARIEPDIKNTALRWVYGATPFHRHAMFMQTKQFDPTVYGQRARDLRQHFQTHILSRAQEMFDSLSRAPQCSFQEALYSPAPYLPNVGGLLWHGTRTEKLLSGEWVIKDGSFFSYDSEMSARYAAVQRPAAGEAISNPGLICYQIAVPLPKNILNFRWIPLETEKQNEENREEPYDLFFTGRLFDRPFWDCFGMIQGFFTSQAEVVYKVWGTGLIVHMAQSIGSVMEYDDTVNNEEPRRTIYDAENAIVDTTHFCRAGVELALAHPRRHLRRRLRPAVDAVITALDEMRKLYTPNRMEDHFGRSYGYADVLAMLYHHSLSQLDIISKKPNGLPPYMRFMANTLIAERLSAKSLVSDEKKVARAFANVNLTYNVSDSGVIHEESKPYAQRRVPPQVLGNTQEDAQSAVDFPTCLLVAGTPFQKRLPLLVADQYQVFSMAPVAMVDVAFREFMLAGREFWPDSNTPLQSGSPDEPGGLIELFTNLLTEGFDYDPETGNLTDKPNPPGVPPFAGNLRQNLLFNYREYLYIVQPPSEDRMGAGNYGVSFQESRRTYTGGTSKYWHEETAYGFSHNDIDSTNGRLRNYREPLTGINPA